MYMDVLVFKNEERLEKPLRLLHVQENHSMKKVNFLTIWGCTTFLKMAPVAFLFCFFFFFWWQIILSKVPSALSEKQGCFFSLARLRTGVPTERKNVRKLCSCGCKNIKRIKEITYLYLEKWKNYLHSIKQLEA